MNLITFLYLAVTYNVVSEPVAFDQPGAQKLTPKPSVRREIEALEWLCRWYGRHGVPAPCYPLATVQQWDSGGAWRIHEIGR